LPLCTFALNEKDDALASEFMADFRVPRNRRKVPTADYAENAGRGKWFCLIRAIRVIRGSFDSSEAALGCINPWFSVVMLPLYFH
jgi:hypothetical protein